MKRDLPDGQSFIFDSKTKNLFIIAKGEKAADVAEAEALAKAGRAHRFSRSQLSNISTALSHVALLG